MDIESYQDKIQEMSESELDSFICSLDRVDVEQFISFFRSETLKNLSIASSLKSDAEAMISSANKCKKIKKRFKKGLTLKK